MGADIAVDEHVVSVRSFGRGGGPSLRCRFPPTTGKINLEALSR
jgi:hypothetical protein